VKEDQYPLKRRLGGPQSRAARFGKEKKEIHDLYSSSHVIRVIKSWRIRWGAHVARLGEKFTQGFIEET